MERRRGGRRLANWASLSSGEVQPCIAARTVPAPDPLHHDPGERFGTPRGKVAVCIYKTSLICFDAAHLISLL